MQHQINTLTQSLQPYPAEQLRKLTQQRQAQGLPIYNFGTGDPRIPLWPKINQAIAQQLPEISQYPSILGSQALNNAQRNHLQRRYHLNDKKMSHIMTLPTRGSKEAIFHIALSLVEPGKRDNIYYPEPGYPVYRSSVLFARGTPQPYTLNEGNNYLWEPWNTKGLNTDKIAAVWVNYPHNPTGRSVEGPYWEKLCSWCATHGIVLLSDECYTDIYPASQPIPESPLQYQTSGVLSFLSLSKRSGLTGHRIGYIAGDQDILAAHARARAHFGLGQPIFMEQAAILAWEDEQHVCSRREVFNHRIDIAYHKLTQAGFHLRKPQGGFYLWVQVPSSYGENDIQFCRDIAAKGVLTTPSSWMGENTRGWFRLSMVESLERTEEAMDILSTHYGRKAD
ncbi:MAG: aminotransferase class I/II-fold pyridoxal phosphate-dependent enzyme [Zetaproteobacteria bacterium]|nr:aminotransferase class I/II-fold pyridoxal phosphate-dependent enzyme [Zetaproteobacteria bacterium]